ncbi:hypothetical protein GIB67_001913 [Kingdonia uniflora]|uniref:Pentatricopeptide repeat-containing protein n=1 Tax=Kingdonia uniflora TaxID=39325 RepID=A0A7J7NWB6_9MAGN|nr:hypothetical protein GIB67_001913 [Kingdonia uniflora]
MVDQEKLKITKFNGSNFGVWKMQIEDYLYQKDLDLPLGGTEMKPVDFDAAKWARLDRKALGTVRLALSYQILHMISKVTTTKGLMETLSAMYSEPSRANKVHLLRCMFTLKMKDNGSVQAHISEFNTIYAQLESVKITFIEEILRSMMEVEPRFRELMKEFELTPDKYSYNIVIGANYQRGNFNEAIGMLDEMEKNEAKSIRTHLYY